MKLKIISFEQACELLNAWTGKNYTVLPDVSKVVEHLQSPIVSQYKLWVICEAYREGKKLTKGYVPYFWLDRTGSGSGFSSDDCIFDSDPSAVGSRLELQSSDDAEYMGNQFEDLYKDVMVIEESEYFTKPE